MVFSKKFEEKIIKDSFSKLQYNIISCKARSKTAEVKVKITSIDLSTIYNELTSKQLKPLIDIYLNGNEKEKIQAKSEAKNIINSYINNELKKENCPKTTNEIKLTLKLENDKWLITTNEELLYALSGRMPQLLRKR